MWRTSYGDAEQRLGPALEPFRRTSSSPARRDSATRDGTKSELDASLKHCATDHFDLYQLHHIQHLDRDVDVAFGKGGAMEVLHRSEESRHRPAPRVLGAFHRGGAHRDGSLRFRLRALSRQLRLVASGRLGKQILEKAREKGVTCLANQGHGAAAVA